MKMPRIALIGLGLPLASLLVVAGCGGSDTDIDISSSNTSTGSSTGGSGQGGAGGDGGMGGSGGSGGVGGTGGMGGSGGSGGGSGGSGGGSSAMCTPEGAFDGAPVDAPDGQWTWVPVPEAKCRNGSSTGFGIRKNAASTKLVIFLEGGGACFNGASCIANPSSFGQSNFDNWKNNGGKSGIFDTAKADNAVADWNFVYVPYCSGDVHAGDATGVDVPGIGAPKNQSFVGYANIGHYLKQVIPTFKGVTEVLLTGVSAGGFGAFYNYDRVAQAFCPTPVSLIDDSGPPMGDNYMAPCLQKRWRDLYNFAGTLPADCGAECSLPDGGGLVNAWKLLGKKYPTASLGLISSDKDGTIAQFYGFGKNNCSGIDSFATALSGAEYAAGLNEVRESYLKISPAWSTYFVSSTSHTYLGGGSFYSTNVQGVSLTSWVDDRVNGAPAAHVGP